MGPGVDDFEGRLEDEPGNDGEVTPEDKSIAGDEKVSGNSPTDGDRAPESGVLSDIAIEVSEDTTTDEG